MRTLTPRSSAAVGPVARADAGTIVVGWLLKLALVIGVVAVLGYDLVGVGAAHLRVTDDANAVATAAREALDATAGTDADGRAAGERAARAAGYTLGRGDLVVSGGVVTVHLSTSASTVVLHRVPWTRPWTVAESDATVRALKTSGLTRQ